MKKLILVNYLSQWGVNADDTRDDCGPACLSMIFNSFGESLSINDVFRKTGALKDNLINFSQLFKAITFYGYTYKYAVGQSIEKLKSLIDSGVTPFVLIHYGHLSNRQDSYTGAHFIVVVGYDDGGYYTEDPDYYGARITEGHQKYYSKSDFEKAWSDCYRDGQNPNNAFIYVERKPTSKPPIFIGESPVGYEPTFEGQDVTVNGVHYKSIKDASGKLVWKVEEEKPISPGYDPTFEGQDVMNNGIHYKSVKVSGKLVWKIESVDTASIPIPVEQQNTDFNDKTAMYEELGFSGKFNLTIGVEKIRQLLAIEKQFVEKDEQLTIAEGKIEGLEARAKKSETDLADFAAKSTKTIQDLTGENQSLLNSIQELKAQVQIPSKIPKTGFKKLIYDWLMSK